MISRAEGYLPGLCLRRAHAKSETPKNKSAHITPQKPLRSHRHIYTPGKTHVEHPPFPLIQLSLVIAVASILRTLFPITTNTTKRDTPPTQCTNLPPLIHSGVGKQYSRPSATPPPTPDPKSKDTSFKSILDKNKTKRQKHQSQDKKDFVTTDKKAQKQKIINTTYQKKTFSCYTIDMQGLTKKKWTALLAHPAAKVPDAIIITEHHLPFTHTPSYVKQI